MPRTPHHDETVLFRETQRYTQHWVVALLALVAVAGLALATLVVASQVNACPTDDAPLSHLILAVALAVVLPLAFAATRQITEVTASGLRVRLAPFQPRGRRVAWGRLAGFRALTYRPIRDYGGWGVRGYGKRVAYNARGVRGVLLTMNDGATLLVGSQDAEGLEAAIAQATGRLADPPPSVG